MKTIGYVSDEMYVAIPDVLAEFESSTGTGCVLRSSPRGAFYSDLADGDYRVTLAKQGFGSKIVNVHLGGKPHQFRLLSDGLLGFTGSTVTARYGSVITTYDEHGMTIYSKAA